MTKIFIKQTVRKMKLLLFTWNGLNDAILKNNLEKLGHTVHHLNRALDDPNTDFGLAQELMQINSTNSIDGIITFNYIPIVAMTCDIIKKPYYSWVFDSPHYTLYSQTVNYPTNHIGIFDCELVDELKKKGVKTVFHLPLSVDSFYFQKTIRKNGNKKSRVPLKSDVSFVGSLYTDARKVNLYDSFYEDNEIWNNIDSVINRQQFNYRENLLSNNSSIDYEYLGQLIRESGQAFGKDYFITPAEISVSSVLEKKATINERFCILDAVAAFCNQNAFDFRLYTTSDTSKDPLLQKVNLGPVLYDAEMPLVFAQSKININVTLRSIHTGIPLRVLDILSCGGFLLTTPTKELLDAFVDGRDLVIFTSPEECVDKINYYLSHEEAREQIAKNGTARVRELFRYEQNLPKLFQ